MVNNAKLNGIMESEESERFQCFDSVYDCVAYDPTNQSQGPESNIVIGLFFRFSLRLQQSIFYLIV